jgi:hypothetical protein
VSDKPPPKPANDTEDPLRRWREADQATLDAFAVDPLVPRPRTSGRKTNPLINWELAEKLYVEGELVGEGEHCERLYSSIAAISARVGTSKGNLDQHISRYRWREKRRLFQSVSGVVRTGRPDIVDGLDGPKSRAPVKRDAEAVLRAYLDQFAEAVEKRSVRYDTIADFERAVRLLAFVRGQAESTRHTHVTVSLEVMAARHKAMRATVDAHMDDEVAGVIGGGDGAPQLGPAPLPGLAAALAGEARGAAASVPAPRAGALSPAWARAMRQAKIVE